MSGMIGTLVMVGVLAAVGYVAWSNKDAILGAFKPAAATAPSSDTSAPADTSGTYDASSGTYKAPKGGYKAPKGGYNGTPGWYTAAGHHHCVKGQSGCVCTDPPKCLGKKGTGHEICADGSCAPGPGECRPDLGRYGATPCGNCPPGTGGGKCAGNGTYAGGGGKPYKAKFARSYYAAGNPALNTPAYQMLPVRAGYYDLVPSPYGGYTYDPTSFAISNERMSY